MALRHCTALIMTTFVHLLFIQHYGESNKLVRTTGAPPRVCLADSAIKKPNQIAWFPTAFQPYFPINEQEVRLCSQSKVCSGPI